MTKPRNKHPVHGILLLNKPQHITSNLALQKVKRLYQARKAGHTGSLDPLATGMLPVCFGEATKFSQYLLEADKCYEVTARLGIRTDTGDALGEVIARVEHQTVSLDALNDVICTFKGASRQIPSMFSALKHQGRPLYEYARSGIEIERQARPIYIHELELDDFDGLSFSMVVVCSKGTYIRNLIDDIGQMLGVGAHVTRLHRRYTAGYENHTMHEYVVLAEKSSEALSHCLLPIDSAVSALPMLALDADAVDALYLGQTVLPNNEAQVSGLCRLYLNGTQFIGLGEIDAGGTLAVKRLVQRSS